MDKFKYLVGYGLKKRVGRKAFIISNIVVLLLMVIVINLPSIIALFTDGDEEVTYNIMVYNNTEKESFLDDLSLSLNANLEEEMYFLTAPTEEFDEDYFWQESDQDVAIIVNGDIANPSITIYTDDAIVFAGLSRTIELLIVSYQVPDYEVPAIVISLPPDYESPEESMVVSSMMSLLVLPLFMLVTMATQFVGVDIIEEKSTKAIETIISSVPAKSHFYAKIISSILFVIIQGGLMLVYALVAYLVSRLFTSPGNIAAIPNGGDMNLLSYLAEIMPNWPAVLVIALLFMVIGTLLYLVIAALFASMAVTQEDYQLFQTPLMLILLASFYAAMFGPMGGANTFVRILSYIPIVAPMLTPVAYASGIISLAEALISLFIVIITLGVLTVIFTPVYRVSILSYDQTKFFSRVKSYFVKGYQSRRNKK